MNKPVVLRITNFSLLISFGLQSVSGLILFFEVKTPWSEFISAFHGYNGLLMIALVIVHLVLNWGWLKANIFKKNSR